MNWVYMYLAVEGLEKVQSSDMSSCMEIISKRNEDGNDSTFYILN